MPNDTQRCVRRDTKKEKNSSHRSHKWHLVCKTQKYCKKTKKMPLIEADFSDKCDLNNSTKHKRHKMTTMRYKISTKRRDETLKTQNSQNV